MGRLFRAMITDDADKTKSELFYIHLGILDLHIIIKKKNHL